jgi:DNA-binding HxlR family transcriptional regulator
MQQQTLPCVPEDIFSILADKLSVEIITAAYAGLHSTNRLTNQSKKQYYVRLKRLVEMGIVEKQDSVYKIT